MRSAGVVAFELIVDFGGRIEQFFQKIRARQRRRAVHLVKFPYFLRNGDKKVFLIKFLLHHVFAKYFGKFFRGAGF